MIVSINNDFSFSIDLEQIIEDKYKGVEVNREDIKSAVTTTASKYVFQLNNSLTKQNLISEINGVIDNIIKGQYKIKYREERINSILK